MSEERLRIIFMGTPQFAVPGLEALQKAGYEIVFAVTQPDRPKGRGLKLVSPPIKERALELGLSVVQPESIRDNGFLGSIAEARPDLVAVIAFGQILPPGLLNIPKLGAVNVHPSLLPKLRGAGPIQWAIIRGELTTGVTTMLMNRKMDAGDILLQEAVDIYPTDTAGTLHDRLAQRGARLLVQTIEGLRSGRITPVPQKDSEATQAPRLLKDDGRIRWSDPAQDVCNLIRGLDPWPSAFTFIHGMGLSLFGCVAVHEPTKGKPGEFMGLHAMGIQVATGSGSVIIKEVKLEGRKRLEAAVFLRGTPLAPGTMFESA